MKKRIMGILVFLCVSLLVFPAGALDASLTGRWVSLQYGALTFHQAGNSFTAVWTGANASGTVSGGRASFRFWSGASFEACDDANRGYGTLALSADGNTLSGSWANLSKKEPESGSFTALRLSSLGGQTAQDAAPAPEEPTDEPAPGTESPPPGTSPTQGAGSQQAAAGPQPSAVKPPDELNLLPGDIPPEYAGAAAAVISDLEASVLKIFGVFDDDPGDVTSSVPQPPGDTALPEDPPPQDNDGFWDFFSDLWTSLWGE